MPPGLKYRHYAPDAPMTLFVGDPEKAAAAARGAAAAAEAEGKKAGIIDFGGDVEKAAKLFYKELRRLGTEKVDVIFAACVKEDGIGVAVMNRMRNAANGNIVEV